MAWEYSDKTKQIFLDAVQGKPGTHLGELETPDGFGEHGSITCGDALRFTFRVRRHPSDPLQDVITEARYLTFGCTSAIAASEALCAIIEQGAYTPPRALQVTNADIVGYLGGLPPQKIHCSVMGAEALQAAVFDWARKRGVDLSSLGQDARPGDEKEGRIVCKCFSVTEPYLRRKIKELNLRTIADITNAIKAGGACMSCHYAPGGLQDILDESWGRRPGVGPPVMPGPAIAAASGAGARGPGADGARDGAPAAGAVRAPEPMSPYQLSKKVERVLDDYVRPMLKRDGGDIELVDIKDRLVYCRLQGACAACAGAAMTLKALVERALQEKVDGSIRVIAL